MTSENETWESLKTEYLLQVEKTLSLIKDPRRKEVLDDVRSHLERRFIELEPGQQTWENLQAIITEMGPPSDYTELLSSGQTPAKQNVSAKYLLFVVLIFAVIAGAMIILPLVFSNKEKAYELEEGWNVENLSHPFENDPEIIGYWKSVDFVERVIDFDPDIRTWKGDLFLKDFRFMPDGRASLSYTWTKDWIWHSNGRTKAQYKIKKMAGATYLFLPWLSGDVTIRGQKPRYYVLKKVDVNVNGQAKQSRGDAEAKAVSCARAWLELIDEKAYGKSRDETAEYFKRAVGREQWGETLVMVRESLGSVISRKVKSTEYTRQVPGGPDGEYVVIQFETSFENKSHAVETVTPMLDEDGIWRVSGYYIK